MLYSLKLKLDTLKINSVFKYGMANILPRSVALFGALLLTPLAISRLGIADYGIWVLATLIPTLILAPDFGITYGLVNEISKIFLKYRSIASQKLRLLNLNKLLKYIAFGWLSLGLIIAGFYTVQSGSGAQSPRLFVSLCLSLATFSISIPATLWARTQLGIERGHEALRWEGIGKLASFLISLLILLFVPNLYLFIIATLLPTTICAIINGFVFRNKTFGKSNQHRENLDSLKQIMRDESELISSGHYFFIAQVAYLIGLALDPFIINYFLDSKEVAYYSIIRRPFDALPLIITLFSTGLWPVFNKLNEMNQIFQLRSIINRLFMFSIIMLFISSSLIILFKFYLYGFIGNNKITPYESDIFWIALQTLGVTIFIICNNYLYAVNLIKLQSIILLISACISVLIKIYVIERAGVHAYFSASAITYTTLTTIPVIYLTLSHVNRRLKDTKGDFM
ncbi:lipopolysaccharide biosynthesis protein [Deinococcus marmoris]|uniref:O-antigen flippase Wzx n=1 Tax=Deinococcus marmoris TaxID=249408 RepID=A0A1U7NSF0_9DEIO|nr:oligosaccharide flippase family protein [Deinococcus marmoris]OLV15848.1 O-antigen flippase Wzx [Deinococcus marmoris]